MAPSGTAATPRTRLLLVLHCHLPYVRHPEHEDFLEEDWFYEAVAEAYVPLLHVMEGLAADGVPFKCALSMSPTLCEMMANELLRARCIRYIERHVELAGREVERTQGTPFHEAALMYRRRYEQVRRTFVERLGGRLLSGFAALEHAAVVELLGSAATHAILPLLKTPEGRRAQVAAGLANFQKHFGGRPQGFWLPECAYGPGVDALLAQFGIHSFFLDTHGVLLATPRPPLGVFAPLFTPAGPAAFGRDVESSRQVWSAAEGYPGDRDYREFYRDLGYDADLDYVRPCLGPGGPRRPIGFKYHRITGRDVPLGDKQPYVPSRATHRAALHAEHFVRQRLDQGRRVRAAIGVAPVIVCPYDAELFGHWWFEGPQFLDFVARKAASEPALTWTTPAECLARPGAHQEGRPAFSTWGDGGYLDVWVNGSNDWLYGPLEAAERNMAEAAATWPRAEGLQRRALNQCARELLLAQASDWPFLMSAGTAADYARRRFNDLLGRFNALLGQLRRGAVSAPTVAEFESLDDAFPEVDYALFAPQQGAASGPPQLTP
jgi:1,4-alpha-glucan branching enzyme